MSSDKAAIEAAVQTYFDGLYEADADKLGLVFHPTSELTFVQEGKIVVWSRDQWLDNVRKRESAKSKGSPRDDAILDFARGKSRGKRSARLVAFCDEQEPFGLTVKTMHNTGTLFVWGKFVET